MNRYTIAPDLAGSRLDQALPQLQPGLSRSYAQQLIDEGRVLVNGRLAKASARLKADDTVEITIPPPAPVEIAPEAIPLTVVYEDADVLVIDKPAGLVVHPAPGHAGGTLVNALLAHTDQLSLRGDIRPGIRQRNHHEIRPRFVVARAG